MDELSGNFVMDGKYFVIENGVSIGFSGLLADDKLQAISFHHAEREICRFEVVIYQPGAGFSQSLRAVNDGNLSYTEISLAGDGNRPYLRTKIIAFSDLAAEIFKRARSDGFIDEKLCVNPPLCPSGGADDTLKHIAEKVERAVILNKCLLTINLPTYMTKRLPDQQPSNGVIRFYRRDDDVIVYARMVSPCSCLAL